MLSKSQLLYLPSELISIIADFLPHKDQLAFALVSSRARLHVLPPLFHNFSLVKYGQDPGQAYEFLKGARPDIKNAIRPVLALLYEEVFEITKNLGSRQVKMERHLYTWGLRTADIFGLLEALPNLSDLDLDDAFVKVSDVARFAKVAKRTPLRNLSFAVEHNSVACGPTIIGPECLRSLCVEWRVHDSTYDDEPGKSIKHLSEFIRPSLGTLTHLDVTDCDRTRRPTTLQHLDFRQWPVCPSLRNLQYTTFSRDVKLFAVSEKFPNLTHLGMMFDGYDGIEWAAWTVGVFYSLACAATDTDTGLVPLKEECLDVLSTFTHLAHLKLSLDLEVAAHDSLDENYDLRWYRRCLLRRHSVCKQIAAVCPALQRCEWLQRMVHDAGHTQMHSFVASGETGRRVVRPVVMWWMEKEYGDEHGGPLPLDMVIEDRGRARGVLG